MSQPKSRAGLGIIVLYRTVYHIYLQNTSTNFNPIQLNRDFMAALTFIPVGKAETDVNSQIVLWFLNLPHCSLDGYINVSDRGEIGYLLQSASYDIKIPTCK